MLRFEPRGSQVCRARRRYRAHIIPGEIRVLNVREVLQNHSQSTTLEELESRGRSRVRVINAAEIARLIEESVRHTIAQAQEGDGLRQLVERSKAEFTELKRQKDAEQAAREDGLRQLETAKSELTEMRGELTKLSGAHGELLQKSSVAEGELSAERARVEELRKLIEVLTKERDLARDAEREARAASKEQAPAAPAHNELLTALAAQVAKLTEKMNAPAAPVAASAPTPEMTALETRLEKLSSGISDRLERFGLSIGVSGAVSAENVNYEKIFTQTEKLESNVEHLEVKQRKAAGIGDALERMKKMKLGPEN